MCLSAVPPDVTLAVYELLPDGKLFWLSYYLGRASYAGDMSVRKLLNPGVRSFVPISRTPLSRCIFTGTTTAS
jgi:hypothetical protein